MRPTFSGGSKAPKTSPSEDNIVPALVAAGARARGIQKKATGAGTPN